MKVTTFTVTNNSDKSAEGWLTEDDITSRIVILPAQSLELTFPDNPDTVFSTADGIEKEMSTEMEDAEGKLD